MSSKNKQVQEPADAGSSRSDWIVDRLTRAVLGLALALPFSLRRRFVAGVAARVIGPLAGYGKRARSNLAYVWPDMPAADRRRIARGSLRNFGAALIENYSPGDMARMVADIPVTGPGLAAVEQAKARGQGVIFVTGHFGNYEAPRHALNHLGYQVGGLYRPMSNVFFNDHYVRTMEAVSGEMFEQGRRGTMGFARHIKSGGMAVLLFDLFEWRGQWLEFMGKKAKTATSAAEIALKFDALVVPYFGIRDGNGFRIEIQDPVPASDPITMTQDLNTRLGRLVQDHPDQWMWFHRRWKSKRDE